MEKIKTNLATDKLPFLDRAGVKYDVLSADANMSLIELNDCCISEIFLAGWYAGFEKANEVTRDTMSLVHSSFK